MKYKKLIVNTAIAWLLLVASSAAMAVDCVGGVIAHEIVESVEVNGINCTIYESTITGGVTVTDSRSIVMLDNTVGGSVLIENSDYVAVINNFVTNGNIDVQDSNDVRVIDSETFNGNIRVRRNISAWSSKNKASRRLVCRNNTDLIAFLNNAGQVLNCQGRLPF